MTRSRATERNPRPTRTRRPAFSQQAWFRPLVVFAGFLALTLWLRRFTYVLSALDWDESLYLLMARSLLEGHLPYTAIYDNKPPA